MSINGIYTAGVPAGYEAAKVAKRDSRKAGDFMQAAAKTETAETTRTETTRTENKSAEHAEKAFMSVGSRAPEEVKKAWMEAAGETGLSGPGIGSDGMMTHISQMMVQRLKKSWLNGGAGDPDDILGNSVSSALQAAKQALYDLENPLVPENTRSLEVQRCRLKEKAFYQMFIEKLEKL